MMGDRRSTDERRADHRREQNMWVATDRRSGLERRNGFERRSGDDRRSMGDRRMR